MKAKFKTTIAYVLILLLLTSLMIFPDNSYGTNDIEYFVAIKTANGKYLCAENGGGSIVKETYIFAVPPFVFILNVLKL